MKKTDISYLIKTQPCPRLTFNNLYKILNDKYIDNEYKAIIKGIFFYQLKFNTDGFDEKIKITDEKYIEIINLYNEFLNNYTSLEDKYNINDVYLMSYFFNKLMKNGILSYKHNINHDNHLSKININMNLFGISILNGNGVCRHVAPLFVDILRKKNIDSNLIYTNQLFIDNISLNDDVYNEIVNNNLFLKTSESTLVILLNYFSAKELNDMILKFKNQYSIEKVIGNHVIVGVKDQDDVIFVDPLNNCILFNIDYLPIKNSVILYNKSYKSNDILINEKGHINVVVKSSKEYKNSKFKQNISSKQLKEKRNYIAKLYNEEEDEFEKFYNENKKIYNDIHNKLLQLHI